MKLSAHEGTDMEHCPSYFF